ncbi:hypothetical protein CSC02_0080 [Enterobacter hormaechei subsp. hoffmannii]|nr:hypothetical protein CSC02_0080 [Enterobacter hormaechei subsp. hoffmannii]
MMDDDFWCMTQSWHNRGTRNHITGQSSNSPVRASLMM